MCTRESVLSRLPPITCIFTRGGSSASAQQCPRLTPDRPSPPKAPEKLKVTAITCLSILHGCVSRQLACQHAGQALIGWDVTVVDGGGNPSKQNSAILDAVSADRRSSSSSQSTRPRCSSGSKPQERRVLVVSGSNGIDTPIPWSSRRLMRSRTPSMSAQLRRRSGIRRQNG